MLFDNDILKYLILTGALHGIYLVLILLTSHARRKSPDSWLMAIVLVAFSIYLANTFIYLSEFSVLTVYLSGTSMPILYLVGPAYWFYLQFITGAKARWYKLDIIHLVPMVVCFIAASPYYFMDCQLKLEHIMSLKPDHVDLPIQRGYYFGAHIVQTLFYLYLSFSTVNKFKLSAQRQTREFKLIRNWTVKTYSFMIILAGIYTFSFVGFVFFQDARAFFRDLFDLTITFFLHAIGFWMIKDSPILTSSKSGNGDYAHDDNMKKKVLEVLQSKPYLKPDFTLKDLSDALQTNTVYASQLINYLFNKSFTELINQYRVEEVKERLKANPEDKLLAVALESGFSNKNTFTRVFKKFTRQTPSEYRESQKKRSQ